MQIVIFKNGGKIVKMTKKVGDMCLLRYLWISLFIHENFRKNGYLPI